MSKLFTDAELPGPDGVWPLAVIDGKPVAPCIGSGFCCKKAPCGLAISLGIWTREGEHPNGCPKLEHDGERHWCGLITNAAPEEAKHYREYLYVGAGCCMPLNSERLVMLKKGLK